MEKRCFGCMEMKYSIPICEHCGFDERQENASHQLQQGTILRDQYLIGRVLGQGGFGITYLGWDLNLETAIAVKEFFPRGAVGRDSTQSAEVFSYNRENDPVFHASKKRFLREAQTLAKLENIPQVVRIRNFFEENNTAYIVMEYIRGNDLREYTLANGGKIPAQTLLPLLKPTLEALMKVHEAGLVHRDISPDNIMLLPDGRTKLLDFGAVRQVEHAGVEKALTHSTQAILKHGFAPIEQYQSKGSLGPWTDVYALCGTIFYCLTGEVPPEAGERIMEGEDLAWDQVPGLTNTQRQALIKGTALLPRDRTHSVKELYDKLYDRTEELERIRRQQQEEAARKERERLERERLERERLEQERLERERQEKERQRQEKLEQERLKRERQEQERLERQRQKQEKQEKEKQAREQKRREKREREERQKQTRHQQKEAQAQQDQEKRQQRELERKARSQAGTIVLTGIEEIPQGPKKPKEEKKNKGLSVFVILIIALVIAGGVIAIVSGGKAVQETTDPQPMIQVTETTPEETVPAQQENPGYVIQKIDDSLRLDAETVSIRVEEGTKFTVTLSGLDLKDSYVTNFTSSEAQTSDYYWRVGMHFDSEQETGYAVRTMCLADNPGQENSVSLADMGHTLSRQTERYKETTLECKVTMTHTDSSITWTFDTTEEPDFRFEDVKLLSVSTYDIQKGEENAYTSYTIPVSGVETGAERVELTQNGNVKEIKGSNLHIRVENDKNYTVTLSGLDIRSSYTKNLPESFKGLTEYGWHVKLFTGGDDSLAYGIWTNCNADNPGAENVITMKDMWSAVMEKPENKNSWSNILTISNVTHTKDSITWKFTSPNNMNLSIEDVKLLEVNTYDQSNPENPYTQYFYSLEEELTIPQEQYAKVQKSGNVMEAKWDNLHIRVENDREVTATVTGLNIRDSYQVDLPETQSGHSEYCWSLRLGDYWADTGYWPMNPGKPRTITMKEMDNSLLKHNASEGNFAYLGEMQMSYTSDSITWNFTLPEDKDFQFEELDHVGLLITDVAKDPESSDYYTYYLGAVEEEPESENETVVMEKSGSLMKVDASNLYIETRDSKNFLVELKNVDIRKTYDMSLAAPSDYFMKYGWVVGMYTDQSYEDRVMFGYGFYPWQDISGKAVSNTQMIGELYQPKDDHRWYPTELDKLSWSQTDTGIRWEFTIPDNVDFRFEEVTGIEVSVVDIANIDNPLVDYYYTIAGIRETPKSMDGFTQVLGFENVNIQVQNGKDYTITMTGLDIQDSYVTNLSSSSKNDGEYRWEVWMFTEEDRSSGYAVRTAVWAFEPGKNFRKTIDEMQTDVWTIDKEHHSSVVRNVSVDMTHTKDSITWQFTMPDSVDFRLEDVKIVETSVYDVTNKEKPNIDITYMLA